MHYLWERRTHGSNIWATTLMGKQEIGINIMTNESLQVSPDNKSSVMIGCLPVMKETFLLSDRGKIAFHGIFSTINYAVNWFRAILHNIRCLLTVRMPFPLMASIWTPKLIKQTFTNSIAGKQKQITSVSWTKELTSISASLSSSDRTAFRVVEGVQRRASGSTSIWRGFALSFSMCRWISRSLLISTILFREEESTLLYIHNKR